MANSFCIFKIKANTQLFRQILLKVEHSLSFLTKQSLFDHMDISNEDRPSEEIIRVISPPHCARGPKGCEKCREAAKIKRICLLKVFFDHGEIARPMIELERDGIRLFYEYDVIQYFNDKDEAIEYAKKHNITDIMIS